MIDYCYSDGGRREAGFRGNAGDCVTRAIAIASGKPYREVYDALAHGNATQRQTKHSRRKQASAGKRTAANGIWTGRKWFKDYMRGLGFEWTATMHVGSGCKVHLAKDELPSGRLVVMLSRHAAAVVDGVLYDNHDSRRFGSRCVYGYWRLTAD